MIEGLFAIRKAKFQVGPLYSYFKLKYLPRKVIKDLQDLLSCMHSQGYPAVRPELDLVEQEDQLTHEISLQEEIDPEITLGISKDINF